MGFQLIIVVETNEKCKSDDLYIKETINKFYSYDRAHTLFSTVYMKGKGNYKKKKKEVESKIKQYKNSAKGNYSEVIYCFDTDDYDSNPENAKFLKETEQFCKDHGYKHVWFCKDVERVFLGRKVDKNQKKDEAGTFKKKHLIDSVDENRLKSTSYKNNKSNLLSVLDEFPALKRK